VFAEWYRRWRHAGEEGAIAIYAASCRSLPVFIPALAASLCLAVLHLLLFSVVALSIAVAAAGDLRNLRRAIIFTPEAVRYRPTFASLREIPKKAIFVVRRTAITEGTYRAMFNVLAAELTLPYGEVCILPLNMDKGEEALRRLIDIANTTG
jgi:hypothetical protein